MFSSHMDNKNNVIDTTGIEYVSCNLCGQDNYEVLFQAPVLPYREGVYNRDIWDIVRCCNCSLIYANPRMDSNALDALYSFQAPGDRQFVQNWFLDNSDLHRPVWQRFLKIAQDYVPSGKLLDIGCGAGDFLVEARAFGYDVYGQEVAENFITYCRAQENLTIYGDFLENLDLGTNSFDCVTSFDVIEHHPNPKLLVTQMYELLRPGGLAILSTPDIGNFYARLYGAKWRHIVPIGHINYFSRKTLACMMVDCGFRIVHSGGRHTIDDSRLNEWRNYVIQFLRLIVLRAFILIMYKPFAMRISLLRKWQIKWGEATLNHDKLLMQVSNQIIMNDDQVIFAVKE